MTIVSVSSVQNFIDPLLSLLKSQHSSLCNGECDIEPLVTGLKSPGNPKDAIPNCDLPALRHLGDAIKNGHSGSTAIRDLVRSFQSFSHALQWYRRRELGLPDFMHGHANASIVGPKGLEERAKGVLVGVSLLAPGVSYPNHHHPPEELYIVMSEGEWRQNDAPWHSPGIGGFVHNPPNIAHTMRANSKPLLAIWCLWHQIETDKREPSPA